MNEAAYHHYGLPNRDRHSEFIKAHLYLVDYLVDRMLPQLPNYLNRDDMTSAAMEGLISAARRFDPDRGVLFKTFAEPRIRGAILDEVRKMDWYSRTLRDKHTRLTETIRELEVRLGRSPEEDEIASAMELSLDEYRSLLGQVSHLGTVSLHETIEDSEEGQTFLDILQDERGETPEAEIEQAELTRKLAACLNKLSEKERLVISLLYYEGLAQKEIAEVMELSEGRISQLHSQALHKLKARMQREVN